MMRAVDDRAPLPTRLHVICPHKEREAIISIQLMQIRNADLPTTDRKSYSSVQLVI